MFTHDCTVCERTMLVFPAQVTAARQDADGTTVLSIDCWCGAPQEVRHGLAGSREPALADSAA